MIVVMGGYRRWEGRGVRVFQFLEYYPFSLKGEGRDEGEIPCTSQVTPRHMPLTPSLLPEGEGLSRRTERPWAGCQGANPICDCPGQTPLAGIHVDYPSSIGLSQLIAWVVKCLTLLTIRYPVWRGKQNLSAVLVLPVLCLDCDFSDSGIYVIAESCESFIPMNQGSDNGAKI
jgi:hypothetical protein